MKCSTNLNFNMKGYDRVRAIYKLKQSINKFGDKLGRKNKLLNKMKRKDKIGHNFINLTINKMPPKDIRPSFTIDILNQKFVDITEDSKNDLSKEEQKAKEEMIESLLNDENIKNENDVLNNSYEYKLKETDLFSQSNQKESNNQILIHDFSNSKNNKNKEFTYLNIIQSMKNFNTVRKNKTYNNDFYNILNKRISPINKNDYKFQNRKIIIKSKFLNGNNTEKNKYNKIIFHNKKIIPKFRSLKLGTKPKMKLNYNVIKLGKNFSIGNIRQNELSIKTRLLFYNKYKKKKEMKLTKIKTSKSQNDIFEAESDSYNSGGGVSDCTKNFGQQTMNGNYLSKKYNLPISININVFKRIPSYIRLPNINRVSFPKDNLIKNKSDCGINFDYYNKNNNYFYLKDIKNNSTNKIYMINPFIRNRIINNLN